LAVILDAISGYIINLGGLWLTAVFILGGLLGLVWLWYKVQPKPVRATFEAPVTLRQPVDRLTYARRGLIVFVSLFRPQDHSPAAKLKPEQWLEAARAEDFETLNLPDSNLATAITSIVSHHHKLAHCWLVSTSAAGGDQLGSHYYAPALVKYLREVEGMDCQFYYDETLAIPLDDDALVAVKTQDRIEQIFKECEALDLTDNDIVADISGCPRSMILGMILACLDGSRDIQFIGTHYDEQARPTGTPFPVLFAFDTEVVDS
jgi:hypothetical protein